MIQPGYGAMRPMLLIVTGNCSRDQRHSLKMFLQLGAASWMAEMEADI